jgi:hypothetical protein
MKEDRIREEHVKETLERLKKIENMVGQSYYDFSNEEKIDVQILRDDSAPPAMFIPHAKYPGVYKANELTIRAMKRDIFVMNESLDELKTQYLCSQCKNKCDQQFWHFCPYCGAKFE